LPYDSATPYALYATTNCEEETSVIRVDTKTTPLPVAEQANRLKNTILNQVPLLFLPKMTRDADKNKQLDKHWTANTNQIQPTIFTNNEEIKATVQVRMLV